jgi:hypothetical protein
LYIKTLGSAGSSSDLFIKAVIAINSFASAFKHQTPQVQTMPLYDIEHVVPLTDKQMESLANAWSDLHANRFNTPKVFINVRFIDVSKQKVASPP